MARIRKAARPGRGRRQTLRWAVGVAASLLVLALAIPRHGATRPAAVPADASGGLSADSGGLSAGDQEDDRLLRDVAFLAQGDDAGSSLGLEDSL